MSTSMREALESAKSWIERWASHVGNCRGGNECACGRTAAEPVAWRWGDDKHGWNYHAFIADCSPLHIKEFENDGYRVEPLYTSPRLDRERDRVFRQMLDALKLIRMYVKEGGVPRYTVTPGAGLNFAIEESIDPAIAAADAIMRETR